MRNVETPLMSATAGKHQKVITWLLKNGANAQATFKTFGTAADIFQISGAPAEHIVYLQARTHCAKPGCSGAGLKKCANCLEVFFCSKDCQVAAWPAHKDDCSQTKGKRQAFRVDVTPIPSCKNATMGSASKNGTNAESIA
jgi:hypothetical protein